MLLSYAIDGVLSFNTKPLRICLYLGLLFMFGGSLYIAAMLGSIFIQGIEVPGYFTTISAVLILGGLQLVSLGVIGEYIGHIYNEVKRRPHYIVGEANVDRSLKIVKFEISLKKLLLPKSGRVFKVRSRFILLISFFICCTISLVVVLLEYLF